jgi:hypothetical protein
MAKETFAADAKNDSPAASAGEAAAQLPATQEAAPLSTHVSSGGAIRIGDLSWSRLNAVNPSSKYDVPGADDGDVVLEKEVVVIPRGSVGRLIVLARVKRFKQDIPFGSLEIPEIYDTAEDATAATPGNAYPIIPFCDVAGLLEWDPSGPITEEQAMAVFPFGAGDHQYALVQYTVQKSRAVDENFARIRTAEFASGGPCKTYVSLDTKQKSFKGNSWWQFTVSATGVKIPEETLAFIDSLQHMG